MSKNSEEFWIPVKENDNNEYIEVDAEKMKQMVEDCQCHISSGNNIRMKFKIPVGMKSNKKWYQFWKRKDATLNIQRESIVELMKLYKTDVKFDENSGEIKINGDSKIPVQKEFWFVTPSDSDTPHIPNINERDENIEYFLKKLKESSKIPYNKMDNGEK